MDPQGLIALIGRFLSGEDEHRKIGIKSLSQAIAQCSDIDDYILWRTSKDVGYEYYRYLRAGPVIPVQVARTHFILEQAKALREQLTSRQTA
jgi:hypothetical protein